jgi:hypothetical protein
MMKNHNHVRLSVRVAIAISMLCLLSLIAWRDVAIYIGAKCGNTEAITEECLEIQESSVADIFENRYDRPLYSLKLKNGVLVAIYQEEANEFFSSAEELEQLFVTGYPITFTYVRKPAFRDGVFALLSATCGERELYPISVGIAPFWKRTRTCLIVDSTILGVASLFLIVPLLRTSLHKRKKKLRKKKKKQARINKYPS